MAETAIGQIQAAFEVASAVGDVANSSYYERQLRWARTTADRMHKVTP